MNYHAKMMNIPDNVSGGMPLGEARVAYKVGHKDARHAAAEIAAKADADIATLRSALQLARSEIAGLPRSIGYEFTHLPAIDAALAV